MLLSIAVSFNLPIVNALGGRDHFKHRRPLNSSCGFQSSTENVITLPS
jgi:hypothetical protein